VTPTLKGGSTLGIPSPPGVWTPGLEVGRAVTRPSIRAGEKLQGFPAGWTGGVHRLGERWKMVGNAVTVPVALWIGKRLVTPGELVDVDRQVFSRGRRWPGAASSVAGLREAWSLTERPLSIRPRHSLAALLAQHGSEPLSLAATRGFTKRLSASSLRRRQDFVAALEAHIGYLSRA
jgi:DNA (cytosine-5)-methyltransferase 1